MGAVLILSALLLLIHNSNENIEAGEASTEAVSEIKQAIFDAIAGKTSVPEFTPGPNDTDHEEAPDDSFAPEETGSQTFDPEASEAPESTQNAGASTEKPGTTADPSATDAPRVTTDPYAGHVDPYDEEAVQKSYEMGTVTVNGYEYIGYITIPAINLELPVMAKWDYKRLKIAPCVHMGSYKSQDLVIAGHNFERHFGHIYKLGHGDLLILTTAEGTVRTYLCTQVLQLEPYEINKLKSGDWDLTLYTCTYGGRHRIVVRFTEVPVDTIDISKYV